MVACRPAIACSERRGLGREMIGAARLDQADVHVQPVGSLIGERLGHEGRLAGLGARRGLDRALEQERLVGGPDRIGDVAEIDLELTGRVLRDRALRRQVLSCAVLLQACQQSVLGIERLEAVDGTAFHARANPDMRPAVAADPAIEQGELELERRDRGEPERLEAGRDRGQHGARVGEERPPVRVGQPRQHLRAARPPGHRGERRRIDPARAVGVALLPDQPGGIDVGAGRIETVERARKPQSADQSRLEGVCREPLAARNPDQIRQDQIDRQNLRAAAAKRLPGVLCRLAGGGIGKHRVVLWLAGPIADDQPWPTIADRPVRSTPRPIRKAWSWAARRPWSR